MNFEAQLNRYKTMVEEGLNALSFPGAPEILKEAMRYSLLSGGKRLRGCLALAACEAAGGKAEDALPFACAVEMIHAYSLIHDDLPSMDNDTLRRGKPTNHVVYGEAMAILAGDGLLSYAFEHLSSQQHPAAFRVLGILAKAAGVGGMLGGQVLDVTNEGKASDETLVRQIHLGKTAALITAPVLAGFALAGADEAGMEMAETYGRQLGLAFQIVDDLLDLEGDAALMGKTLGKDVAEGKLTWPACVGTEKARQDAAACIDLAVAALNPLGEKALFLQTLAENTLHRVQ
ncbi:MAG: polyprenyl synthetase family protein [Clostridia bacterium]|nr:polyprenyl synthetase family protein [Clostridia bacterium]